MSKKLIYPPCFFIEGSAKNWIEGSLGVDERFVKKSEIDVEQLKSAIKNGKIVWEDDSESLD